MTTLACPLCLVCKHFTAPTPGGTGTCAAYPAGIPQAIWTSQVDHRKAQPNDGGIQFDPDTADDADYAASLFDDSKEA